MRARAAPAALGSALILDTMSTAARAPTCLARGLPAARLRDVAQLVLSDT
jgi:hypothetical protein